MKTIVEVSATVDFREVRVVYSDGTHTDFKPRKAETLEERKAAFFGLVREIEGEPINEASERLHAEIEPQ